MDNLVRNLALVDCNNFYVSCERVFRPDLQDKPVLVLSNNDGCVVARSNEVKKLGVKMGEPWFKLRDLAKKHNIIAFSSNYALYADMSNRVMSILSQFSPSQEVYSIDECFLDLTGFHDIRDRAYEIRKMVLQWTGITVCVGIGPSKTLSKLSNHIAKKHPLSKGVFNFNALSKPQQDKILSQVEVSEVWGIGRKLNEKLLADGIETVQQLRDANQPGMRAKYGVVMEKTVKELNGESCIEIEEVAPAKKQIISSRSFGTAVTEKFDLMDSVTHFVSNAAAKLRAQNCTAGMIQVFIQTNRFNPDKPQYNPSVSVSIPNPTADSLTLSKWAAKGLDAIYKPGYEYKKAGIMLSEIGDKNIIQGDMFSENFEPRKEILMETMDTLNARYGKGTLKLSQDGSVRSWGMKADNKSPCYTTNWNEMAVTK
jgi:DNA polymerase V